MEVIIQPNHHQLASIAAHIIRDAIRKKPNLVLGLATGSTPIELYKSLVSMHRDDGLDFSGVTTFNLDEYVGIPLEHSQSYHTFMNHHLFNHVNILEENINIPQNKSENHEEFCRQYEDKIKQVGGIDIQILGIGTDGHIGFNEAGSSLASRTRIVTLSQSTIDANSPYFNGDKNAVPNMAITMGIGTIIEAKQCLLLANGLRKSPSIAKAIEGPITSMVPASILQMHPNTVVLLDEEAASKLQEADFYKRSYENKLALKSQ